MAFQLHLRSQSYPLEPGSELNRDDITSVEPLNSDNIIAKVSPNPSNPSILGLTNLSTSPWNAIQASMTAKVIEPGKTIRLQHGTKITFGSIVAEIVDTSNAQLAESRLHLRTDKNPTVPIRPSLTEVSKSNSSTDEELPYQKFFGNKKALIALIGAFAALLLVVFSLPDPTKTTSEPSSPVDTSSEGSQLSQASAPDPVPAEIPETLDINRETLTESHSWAESFKHGHSSNQEYPSACAFTTTDDDGEVVTDRSHLDYWACRVDARTVDGSIPVQWSDGKTTLYQFFRDKTGTITGTNGERVPMKWHNSDHKGINIVVIKHGSADEPLETWLPAPVIDP